MTKKISLSPEQINRVASRLFSLTTWIEKFGKPIYFLQEQNTIRRLLAGNKNVEEWDIIQHKNSRWYVFLSEQKRGQLENESRIRLTNYTVSQIKEAVIEEGKQRSFARELGIAESHVSRIRRGISRTKTLDVAPRIFTDEEKESLYVSRIEVERFLDGVYSIKDFIEEEGARYNITDQRRLYNMCASRKYYHLPPDWHSVKVDRGWVLYYQPDS